LIQRFRKALNAAFKRSERVMVIIAAHGHEDNGGYVTLHSKPPIISQSVDSRLMCRIFTKILYLCNTNILNSSQQNWSDLGAILEQIWSHPRVEFPLL
jgi:hypothetical protein